MLRPFCAKVLKCLTFIPNCFLFCLISGGLVSLNIRGWRGLTVPSKNWNIQSCLESTNSNTSQRTLPFSVPSVTWRPAETQRTWHERRWQCPFKLSPGLWQTLTWGKGACQNTDSRSVMPYLTPLWYCLPFRFQLNLLLLLMTPLVGVKPVFTVFVMVQSSTWSSDPADRALTWYTNKSKR